MKANGTALACVSTCLRLISPETPVRTCGASGTLAFLVPSWGAPAAATVEGSGAERRLRQKVAAASVPLKGSSFSAGENAANAPQPSRFFHFTGQKANKDKAEIPCFCNDGS